MPYPFSVAGYARNYPLLTAWLVFAAYSAVCAVLVQFFVLPFIAPRLHAGHGLLAGTDAVGYHAIAAGMAEQMHAAGWAAWSFAPQGHAAAGLAAPFYYWLTPSPWSLIPVNAALHATSGIVVMQLTRLLGAPLNAAVAAAALWIVFPSALQWVTQIQKDGFFFAGMLGALLGWTMLLQIAGVRPGAATPWHGAGLLAAGMPVAGLVRLYSFRLMMFVALLHAAMAIPLAAVNAWRGKLPARRGIAVVCVMLSVAAALAFAPRDLRFESAPSPPEPTTSSAPVEFVEGTQWQPSTLLPAFVDRAFMRLAFARHGYLSETYKSAGSLIDLDVQFDSAAKVIVYLPRALQIGFFAPFPSQWFTRGTSPGGTTMRLIAGAEMLVLYPLLIIGLPLAAWRWRARIEFWFGAIFCTFFIATFACVTPNMGSLYRMRYGFLMTLAAFGLAALWMTLEERRVHWKI